MGNNGKNDWGVSYSRITFLEKILQTHRNIAILDRHDDIVFEVQRKIQDDALTIVCVDAYTASLELVMRIIATFPSTNIIFVGGKWAGYTKEAHDFCRERHVGIYNAGELSGGLYKDDFWTYEKFDDKGNSTKSIHRE
jgi:hypothetical protein